MLHPFNCLRAKSKSFLNSPTESVSPGGWPMMLWMNEHFANLIHKKMGSWNPHSHHGRRGPSHHGLSTETAWRAQTLPPPSRNRAGVSTESRRWKSLPRAGSPALTSRTKEGQKEHRSKSKLRPEERMGNYVQLRRTGVFSEWHPSQEFLKILMYGKTNTIL